MCFSGHRPGRLPQSVSSGRLPAALLLLASATWGLASPLATAADGVPGDLLSEIKMSDVVSASATTTKLTEDRGTVLGVVSLSRLLTDGGIRCEVKSQSVFVSLQAFNDATTTVSQDQEAGEQAGVTTAAGKDELMELTVDAEAGRVRVRLPLANRAPSQPVDGQPLMRLITAVSQQPRMRLQATDSALSLVVSVPNQKLNVTAIRKAVVELSGFADRNAATVNAITKVDANQPDASSNAASTNAVAKASPTKPTQPKQTLPKQTQPTDPQSLVGTWSAKVSNQDAWAIRINADQTFTMVHTRSGKNAISKGTYRIADQTLVISESGGVSLSGKLSATTAKSFRWTLLDKNGKPATSLDFQKQST
ncbi:lipocalin family protein [Roseiconus nitratireducens]|uniref:Lipocalin family protein n=1 Tax=Roseiconus nitratireducens TaxID=2605748 RepID=A0A5M6DNW6_9BACT|nr:lipocalin family protein [Roseiconus nitratireducens]KAA5547135.1 lipocalin family protein [Roseiconus nitratireducens]